MSSKLVQSVKLMVSQTEEFSRDLKSYSKKHPTMMDDLRVMLDGPFSQFVVLQKLHNPLGFLRCHIDEASDIEIWKVTHLACRCMSGKGSRTGYRVILGLDRSTKSVTLVQLYHKNDFINEDRERVKALFGFGY